MDYEIRFEEPSDEVKRLIAMAQELESRCDLHGKLLDEVARLTQITAIPAAYFTATEAISGAEAERAWRNFQDKWAMPADK